MSVVPSAKYPVPFSEPPYLCGLPSPYYKPTHLRWQRLCRAYFEEHLLPFVTAWEDQQEVPPTLFETFARDRILMATMATPLPFDMLKKLGIYDILGIPIEDFDDFHRLIFYDEISRGGLAGPANSTLGGFSIAAPYLTRFASPELRDRMLPDLLLGKKKYCIAITEPRGGSDVANTSTTAIRSADGKEWIINGEKKWITGAIDADYSPLVVRTGGPGSGAAGVSVIIVPFKNYPGVTLERLVFSGQAAAGTAHIRFVDVRVPIGNLVGQEGLGLSYVITNLNHERINLATGVLRQARVALSLAIKYCMKREVHGEPLINQPVVRHKLAKVGADLETTWAWLEQLVYAGIPLSEVQVDERLGGRISLYKAKAGLVFGDCVNTAMLLFGAVGYARTGEGQMMEKLYREVPGTKFPGGTEDVLLDGGIKHLVKMYQKSMAAEERGSKL